VAFCIVLVPGMLFHYVWIYNNLKTMSFGHVVHSYQTLCQSYNRIAVGFMCVAVHDR